MKKFFVGIAVGLIIFRMAGVASANSTYTVTDLGTLGGVGARSGAYAINDNGQVVGWTEMPLENGVRHTHAFLYSDGQMTDLGTFGGWSSTALSINNNGQVVGWAKYVYGPSHAFLYSDGQMTDLGALWGPSSSDAYGINDSGQIVGMASKVFPSGYGYNHAFLYSNGVMTDLGSTSAGPQSEASAINNNGQVVGWAEFQSPENGNLYSQAFLYSNGVMTSLGSLSVTTPVSFAYDINDRGQVVGYTHAMNSSGRDVNHAFLYSDGQMIDLGTLGGKDSYAEGINNSGQVVGRSDTVDSGSGFFYSNGQLVDLNTLIEPGTGWKIVQAWDINNKGQIVGAGYNGTASHAILLTPVTNDISVDVPLGNNVCVTPVPEVSVTFADVQDACTLTNRILDNLTTPSNIRILAGSSFEIDSTCPVSSLVTVCLSYDESKVWTNELNLKLFHYTNNQWENITTTVDELTNTVCGETSSFSPFVVGELIGDIHVIPYTSALSSEDTDLVVSFNGSRSACYELVYDGQGIANQVELTCEYSWEFGGSGTVVGGNGEDVVLYRYEAPGTYTASLTVNEPVSGTTASKQVTATAMEVEPPALAADFATSVSGRTVTLTASTLPVDVARVYIYWGDRLRTVSTAPQSDLAGGISHTYARGGRSYNIRVTSIDASHNQLNYTFSEDGDLTVTLP